MDHDSDPRLPLEATLYQVKKTIVGQDGLLERMLVALLARGHLLVEGVPGLAKTMAVKTLAQAIGGRFQRIQFTSDLVPADVVGTRIYNQRAGEFQVSLGPVFTNLLLADEINRAPAKVQSALLEVMQERQVTIGRDTFPAPDPFLVMATQNPIESEGTYPLPEAQLDRFMFKVLVGYPTATQEYVVVERMTTTHESPEPVVDVETLRGYQRGADAVYVDPQIIEYAVRLSTATRDPAAVGSPDLARYVTFGASPRASINMVLGAKALAFLRGRDYALPADVRELARDVLRHRVVLSYEALADDVSPDDVLGPLLAAIPLPGARPHRARPAAGSTAPGAAPPRTGRDGAGGAHAGARAAPPRVAGAAASGRAPAGRLPDGVPRHRRRRRGPARVPVRRRPAPHRLERHRAHGRRARARVPGRPRGHRLAAARPLGVDGLRAGAAAQARRAHRGRGHGGAAALARREPGRRAAVRRRRAARRSRPRRAATRCCGSCRGCCAPARRRRPGPRPTSAPHCAPRSGSCGAGRSS